jgi:CPA2 family monovalent cation:H+ antiporter-2
MTSGNFPAFRRRPPGAGSPVMDGLAECLAFGGADVSPLFALLTMVLVLAVLVSLLLVKARQSLLVGYFVCGVVIANSGLLGMVGGTGATDTVIQNLAEIGVILLMFTLGIEFSLGELRHLWRVAVVGGGMQVVLTSALAWWVARRLGFGSPDSLVLGMAVAVSSTAVAMKSFHDLGQQNNPGARVAMGVALFQDLAVILFFLALPALYGGTKGSVGAALALDLGKGVLFLAGAGLLGRYGITPLLHAVSATRSRELFTLTVVGLCAGVALAGGALHLSMALGAFAAGLVVSESIYSHRILSDILPFKDLFLTLFFVSVGLLVDMHVVMAEWPRVLGGGALVLAGKGLVMLMICRLLRLPPRSALLAAASLASTGEFSLVLIGKAGGFRPFAPVTEQILLACTAVTMGVVPGLMRATGPVGRWCEKRGWFGERMTPMALVAQGRAAKVIADHAIICGYGPVGRSLNEALKRCGVPTLVLELNVDTVRELKQAGQPVLFADATHPEALDLAGIERARFVAFTFPAVASTCAAVPLVRERNPGICIFGRAKYPAEVMRLRSMDVQVIHDERESAVAMVRAAMTSYDRPDINPEEVVGKIFE